MGAVLALRSCVARPQPRVVHTRVVKATDPAAEIDWGDLVARCAAGDQAALAGLYDASNSLVYGLAVRILGDRDLAEDVVVEVYSQAWREAQSFSPARGSAASWLMTLARSRSVDLLRSRRRDRATEPLESAGEVEASTPTPEAATMDAERHGLVRGALSSLSQEQRHAIELAYYSGLSHSEIAERLDVPLGTIKTRIRLGMMRMREMLEHLAVPASAAGWEKS